MRISSVMRYSRIELGLLLASIGIAFSNPSLRADDPPPANTQKETIPLTSPERAAASFSAAEGFRVSLFAAEPMVRQPIGVTTDSRGRLWVAENDTYAESGLNFDLSKHDRIVILDDVDHDGRADKRTVFWDKAQRLTSVELGFGGVWALCPPNLLFIPDRNGDDVPDGPPEVMLDGWDALAVRHNIANGLKWGPDGWLYGRHGILATSKVGAPGTPANQRIPINCGIWRFHPTKRVFEVVCHGTTNSWGMDWNARGEPFFINTVIGHLWHVVPGAHYERMYGEDLNPRLYGLIPQTADHVHWDTNERWDEIRSKGVTPTTDVKGGGHAHSGLMIYNGDDWPDRYRDSALTINLHGRRLNNDLLVRQGAGYVGRHGSDLLKTTDPWFRAVELIYGSDGGVYLADWSDIGECHENDGVHRTSGRIFKITHAQPAQPKVVDVAKLADQELVHLQRAKNEWYARQARRVLQERVNGTADPAKLHELLRAEFDTQGDPVLKLRALWCLFVTNGASEPWLLTQLGHQDEHVRAWIVRLLVDGGSASPPTIAALEAQASRESSGLVLLYLASALQRIPRAERWTLAEKLAAHTALAEDPVFPLMLWYGVESAATDSPERAIKLAGSSKIAKVSRFIARRLTEGLKESPELVNRLVEMLSKSDIVDPKRTVLLGMADAVRGRRKAPAPTSWERARKSLESSPDETIRRLTRELSVVFGDGRALGELSTIAGSKSESLDARRDALRVLAETRGAALPALLRQLLDDRDLAADAVRAMAAFEDPATPELLLARYPGWPLEARSEVIVTLTARPSFARALLAAIAKGDVDRAQIPAFQIRQMQGMADESIRRKVAELWPEVRALGAARKEQIAKLKSQWIPEKLARADLSNGRRLFAATCASCHTLFGEGAKIGPDLTGAQRSNLDYLLENIVEPSATVAGDYRVATIAFTDGRILNGIVGNKTGQVLTIQTAGERLSVDRADVEQIKDSSLSLMPEGLLDTLSEGDASDLIAYLMSPRQVPPRTSVEPSR
jgi:putative membrane-bound dehydrogenase-like protein